MKTKVYFIMLLFAAFFTGCNDAENEQLEPTYKDIDWFGVEDGSDEIQHARYQIYNSTGITVYYSDTLGSVFRGVNGYGDSIFHYEILSPAYFITSNINTYAFSYPKNRTDIYNGVLFLRDQVIPRLSKAVYPKSFLLVEDLTLNAAATEANGKREGNVFRGFMTTLVSHVSTLNTLSDEQKNIVVCDIAAPLYYNAMIVGYVSTLEKFYDVSEKSADLSNTFAKTVYGKECSSTTTPSLASSLIPFKPHWNEYGFLYPELDRIGQISPAGLNNAAYTRYTTPKEEQDAISFITVALRYSESEFQALYEGKAGLNLLMEKFRIIKETVDEIYSKK